MARLTSTQILVKIGQKMWLLQQLEISEKEGVCVKKGYDIYIYRYVCVVDERSKCSTSLVCEEL